MAGPNVRDLGFRLDYVRMCNVRIARFLRPRKSELTRLEINVTSGTNGGVGLRYRRRRI